MYTFLEKTFVLARNGDTEGWMEILVLIIMAVIWAIGGIIKSRANKEQEKISQKPERKPRPSPFERAKAKQKKAVRQFKPSPRKVMRPQPVGHKTAAKPYSLEVYPQQEAIPSLSQIKPKVDKLPRLKSKAVEALKGKQPQAPSQKPPAVTVMPSLLDIDEPDELRPERLKRAILHYEIFSKPVSLRGPSGPIV